MYFDNAFGNLKYSVRSNNEHLSRVDYKSGKKSVTHISSVCLRFMWKQVVKHEEENI